MAKGKFANLLLKERQGAFLIDDESKGSKTKDEYIVNAEKGLIVAFRLYFQAKSKVNLTKVISGKILENDTAEKQYVVETRNGLKYGVPYESVVWLKTGSRWPKGVYEEMKRGSVEVENSESAVFGELETSNFDYDQSDDKEA